MKQVRNTVAIVSLLLTGCTSTTISTSTSTPISAENPRAAIVPSDPAAREKLEAYRAANREEQLQMLEAAKADNRAQREEWLKLPDTQKYIKGLCSLPPGQDRDSEFAIARKEYGIVERKTVVDVAKAEDEGLSVIDCTPTQSTPPASEASTLIPHPSDTGALELDPMYQK